MPSIRGVHLPGCVLSSHPIRPPESVLYLPSPVMPPSRTRLRQRIRAHASTAGTLSRGSICDPHICVLETFAKLTGSRRPGMRWALATDLPFLTAAHEWHAAWEIHAGRPGLNTAESRHGSTRPGSKPCRWMEWSLRMDDCKRDAPRWYFGGWSEGDDYK